jgi:acyl carrier protein phosphodiesterase
MNFLAHIYLSGNNKTIAIGNFIADGIRGKDYKKFPKDIQIGILLHREIDVFTDGHKTVRKSTKRLHENYSHYSGVIVDILYDHFLAKNWNTYSHIPLAKYVDDFYNLLEDNFEILPIRVKKMMPYMTANNWLLSYASIAGISKALEGMNRRTQNRSKMNLAVNELIEYYEDFETEFTSFFEELKVFAEIKLNELNSQ